MARLFVIIVVVVVVVIQCLLPSDGYAIGFSERKTTNGLAFRAQPRQRRYLVSLFSDQHKPEYNTGNNSPVYVNSGSGVGSASSTTPADNWFKFVRQQSSRVIEGAADVATAPAQWLSHIRQYWSVCERRPSVFIALVSLRRPLYLVCVTGILGLATVLYCSCICGQTNMPCHQGYESLALTNLLRRSKPPLPLPIEA